MIGSLRARKEWKFFGVLPRADRALAVAWWTVLVLRGVLPALFAIAMGRLVGAVQRGEDLVGAAGAGGRRVRAAPGAAADPPGHRRQSSAAGPRPGSTTGSPTPACDRRGWATSRTRSSRATSRWRGTSTWASPGRRCSSRWTSSPRGLVEMVARPGLGRWCSPAMRGGRRSCSPARGWPRTGCCARAPSGATATPRKSAARSAMPTTPTGWRSIRRRPRSCGSSGWRTGSSSASARGDSRSVELQWQATRLRERPVAVEPAAGARRQHRGVLVAGRRRGRRRACRSIALVTFATAAVDHQHDRLRRVVVGARRRRRAGRGGAAPARRRWTPPVRWSAAPGRPPACRRARSAFATSPSPTRPAASRCSRASTSRSPPARRWPSSARTAPARRRWPSCSAGSTTPRPAPSRSTASTSATLDLDAWRSRLTAVFQDFIRFELPLRDNVAPAGAPDDVDPRRAGRRRRGGPRRSRHRAGARLRGRHRPFRRPVAARGAGPRAVRRAARRRRGAARRAHRAARRARRGRDLRPHPRRHAARHDDPDLAPVLDRAPRRPHLRARARPGGRAGHARRADGGRRPLPHHVRPAGLALRCRRRRGGRGDLRCPRA